MSRLGANRHNIVIGIAKRNNFHGHVMRVNFVGNGRIADILGTPLRSPIGCGIVSCRIYLHHSRTRHVRVIDVARTRRLRRTISPTDITDVVTRSTASYNNNPSRLLRTTTTHRHGIVGITLINGPGYNGAALFGFTDNTRRHINGCSNIAISTGTKRAGFRNCHVGFISLPNACSLSTCAPRRLCIHGRLVSGAPSIIVGILSTSGLRHGLCLAARLVSVRVHVITTLGVFSRARHHNSAVRYSRLDSLFNIPVIPAMFAANHNISSLLHRIVRLCRDTRNRSTRCERVRVGRNRRLRRNVARVRRRLGGRRRLHLRCSAHCLTVGLLRCSGSTRTIITGLTRTGRVLTRHSRTTGHIGRRLNVSSRATVVSTGCNFVHNTLRTTGCTGNSRGGTCGDAHVLSGVLAGG